MSLGAFQKAFPSGKVPRNSNDYGKVFVCRRGCNIRTASYTDEFVWEDLYTGVDDINTLIESVEKGTKATRKRKTARQESPDDLYDAFEDGDEGWGQKRTPRKPSNVLGTPRKPKSLSKPVTPSSHRKYADQSAIRHDKDGRLTTSQGCCQEASRVHALGHSRSLTKPPPGLTLPDSPSQPPCCLSAHQPSMS